MTKMHNPPHPGETLREDVLPALGLTITDAAMQLGCYPCGFVSGIERTRGYFAGNGVTAGRVARHGKRWAG